MDPWIHVRLRARNAHRRAYGDCGDRAAPAIVAAALRQRDLEVAPFVPDTRFSPGVLGVYDRVGRLVSVDATLPPGLRERVLAHEIGHHDLHDDTFQEVSTPDLDAAEDADSAGYSPRERREIEAEIFAAEFLCPGDWLDGEVVGRGRHPDDVAAALALPASFVAGQAVRVLCLPMVEHASPRCPAPRALTACQESASNWSAGPLLVSGGPGTGKTTALVRRVEHLLASGVHASRILTLTFSMRAAADLRDRIGDIAGSAGVWVGTIHGFGSEVVHGWHHRLDRGDRLKVVDRLAAIEMLEANLNGLPARYRGRRDHPAVALAPLLQMIGRCKSGMVAAADYAAAAGAADLDGPDESCGSRDFALAFAVYEDVLRSHGAVDLDDLVHLAATLFEGHDDIAVHYGKRFSHVLLDEAQDLDRAATRLLQSLCGPGTCLWAAGDEGRCIHRFRGATTDAMQRFVDLFGGNTLTLAEDLRDTLGSVGPDSEFVAPKGEDPAHISAGHGSAGPVRVVSAPTLDDEAAAVAEEVERLAARGVARHDQAIIARSHHTLDALAVQLARRGMPILHIGDLLARDDVAEALAVLAIACRDEPTALLRLTARPAFAVPRRDAIAVVLSAARGGASAFEFIRHRPRPAAVEPTSWSTLRRLGAWLDGIGMGADAATIVARWMSAARPQPGDALGRLALFCLVRFASRGRPDAAAFMSRVRRAVAVDAGREVGTITPEMECAGLVRALTIHASKGSEFGAVHLPGMSSCGMPARRQPDHVRPPPDLDFLAMTGPEHDDEERALFSVAMSRARGGVSISYPRREGHGRRLRPSPFLKGSSEIVLRPDRDGPLGDIAAATRAAASPAGRASHRLEHLDTYAACPARYRFEHVDGLTEMVRPSGEDLARSAALAALRELDAILADDDHGIPMDGEIDATLALAWRGRGPTGHADEGDLWQSAAAFVRRVSQLSAFRRGSFRSSPIWRLPVGTATVEIAPDRVVEHPWETVVVEIVASEDELRMLPWKAAMHLAAARRAFPGMRVIAEPILFDEGDKIDVTPADEDAAAERYAGLVANIEAGLFPPHRSPRECSKCPFLMACGA